MNHEQRYSWLIRKVFTLMKFSGFVLFFLIGCASTFLLATDNNTTTFLRWLLTLGFFTYCTFLGYSGFIEMTEQRIRTRFYWCGQLIGVLFMIYLFYSGERLSDFHGVIILAVTSRDFYLMGWTDARQKIGVM